MLTLTLAYDIMRVCPGDVYIGDFVTEKQHGHGTLKWWNGDTYTGNFVNTLPHGDGQLTLSNQDCFQGNFVDGCIFGHGKLTCTVSQPAYEPQPA